MMAFSTTTVLFYEKEGIALTKEHKKDMEQCSETYECIHLKKKRMMLKLN